jgi:hypothetical protein
MVAMQLNFVKDESITLLRVIYSYISNYIEVYE